MKEYTDNEIVECLRNRENYVVCYLWARYLPMVKLIVKPSGGTMDDSKDIFQDGLMIILEKIDSREFSLTCRFKTYFYCICENLWNTVLAKRRAASNYLFYKNNDTERDISEQIDNNKREKIFHEAFDSLDKGSREILQLYWKEMSPQEIADKLGYTNGYVRKKKCEAQAELTARVRNHPGFKEMEGSERVVRKVVL